MLSDSLNLDYIVFIYGTRSNNVNSVRDLELLPSEMFAVPSGATQDKGCRLCTMTYSRPRFGSVTVVLSHGLGPDNVLIDWLNSPFFFFLFFLEHRLKKGNPGHVIDREKC